MECRVPNGGTFRVALVEHVAASNGVLGFRILVSCRLSKQCLHVLLCSHSLWCLKANDDIEIILSHPPPLSHHTKGHHVWEAFNWRWKLNKVKVGIPLLTWCKKLNSGLPVAPLLNVYWVWPANGLDVQWVCGEPLCRVSWSGRT